MNSITEKPRYEYKYLCSIEKAEQFKTLIKENMYMDPNASSTGYTVNSIYYDDDKYTSYHEKIDGEDQRVKIRLRFYGDFGQLTAPGDNTVFLEAKHRYNNLIHKERLLYNAEFLPFFGKSNDLHNPESWISKSNNPETINSLIHLIEKRPISPQCWLSYHREPYLCRLDPSLRITFDTNLRVHGSNAIQDHHANDGTLFLPENLCVLEIKFHWAIPLWVLDASRHMGLQLRRYSKYCSALEELHPWISLRSSRYV